MPNNKMQEKELVQDILNCQRCDICLPHYEELKKVNKINDDTIKC